MNYYEKYVKYKSKYLALIDKNSIQIGGDVPTISHPDRINFFTDEHMAQHLNPIYGLVMYKSGFISNTFHLHNSGFIDTPISKIIKKSCKIEPSGIIKPTNDIMQKIKPIDFGRYIAIKYINMTNVIIKSTGVKVTFIDEIQLNKGTKYERGVLSGYINKLNKFIPITVEDGINYNEEIYFHIILYYMWWTAYNDDGITQYYNGINEVFSIITKCDAKFAQYRQIDLKNPPDNNFESQLIEMTREVFTIYNQEWSRHFCRNPYPPKDRKTSYPDCGEVTARNLINLLCFDGEKFDIKILKKFDMHPKLIEYYEEFDTFEKQSIVNKLIDTELNARDSWSQLIILHASHNINFTIVCNDNIGDGGGGSKSESTFRFEVNSGLAMDNNKTNFLQLIQNLLGIESWANLEEPPIMEIKDNINSIGIGKLNIIHKEFGEFVIHCQNGHYSMKALNKATFEINYDDLDKKQIDIINKLLRKDGTDYMWIKFDSDLLARYLSYPEYSKLKLDLLKLSMTDQFDSDVRRRIVIDANASYFNDFVNMGKDSKLLHKLEEYTYTSDNFDFMNNPLTAHLNININRYISEIDLSPLSNLTTIGNEFLFEFNTLTSIDLHPLSQLTTIGDYFLYLCSNLKAIDLSQLSKLTTIGDYFLSYCGRLEAIDLSQLSKLTTIGHCFLEGCTKLISIDLSSLTNIRSIGDRFLSECTQLRTIYLPTSTNITVIPSSFLARCVSLEEIDLSPLTNITAIADDFLTGCVSLEEIDLSGMHQLKTIGKSFLKNCDKLNIIICDPEQFNLIRSSLGNEHKKLLRKIWKP